MDFCLGLRRGVKFANYHLHVLEVLGVMSVRDVVGGALINVLIEKVYVRVTGVFVMDGNNLIFL